MIVQKRLKDHFSVEIKCKSGLGLKVASEGARNTKGEDLYVSVGFDRDPKIIEGWHEDWLDYGDKTMHLRPQAYYGVPVELVEQLVRYNGGPTEGA